jgi:hypothetical protein
MVSRGQSLLSLTSSHRHPLPLPPNQPQTATRSRRRTLAVSANMVQSVHAHKKYVLHMFKTLLPILPRFVACSDAQTPLELALTSCVEAVALCMRLPWITRWWGKHCYSALYCIVGAGYCLANAEDLSLMSVLLFNDLRLQQSHTGSWLKLCSQRYRCFRPT